MVSTVDQPRIRTRRSGGQYVHTSYLYNLTSSSQQEFSFRSNYNRETIEDTVHPEWRERIARGEIINDPVEYTRIAIFRDLGKYEYTSNGKQYLFEGSLESYYGYFVPAQESVDLPGLIADAKLGAIANLDSTPYAMLEDVFEVKETLRFLRNPLKTFMKTSKSFKKTRRSKQRRGLSREKALASSWLEYRFAVMPLLNSVSNLVSGIAQGPEAIKLRPRRVTSYRTDKKSSDSAVSISNKNYERTSTSEIEARAIINYYVTNPIEGYRQLFGFRAKDIPVGLWNVVPLSFMVDRMFDMSSAMKAGLNLSDPDIHIRFGCVSTKSRKQRSCRFLGSTHYSVSNQNVTHHGSGYTYLNFDYERQPWSPGVGDIVPRLKPLGLVNSLTKTADFIALIIQNFK
jgi:hypothetical protein